jgi:hypothetical protein
VVCVAALWATLEALDLSVKKRRVTPLNRSAPTLPARIAWRETQGSLSVDRLVFIDETWASTAMTRRYGRAKHPRGKQLRAGLKPDTEVEPERSAAWLAHQSGGLGVGGSNPLAPTNKIKGSPNPPSKSKSPVPHQCLKKRVLRGRALSLWRPAMSLYVMAFPEHASDLLKRLGAHNNRLRCNKGL